MVNVPPLGLLRPRPRCYAPIKWFVPPSIPGADGGGFAVKILPEGLVLSWDCSNLFKLSFVCINLCEFHRYPYLPISHCAQIGRYGVFVRGWYAGLCPKCGGLFHYDMSVPLLPPHQAPGSVGRAGLIPRLLGRRKTSFSSHVARVQGIPLIGPSLRVIHITHTLIR